MSSAAMRPGQRLAVVLSLAALGALLGVLVLLAALEPVLHDGWGSFARVRRLGDDLPAALGAYSYARHNPRIGQLLVPLTYFNFPVHEIVTPSTILFLLVEIFALATGRWPHPLRVPDTTALLVASALVWWSMPFVGEVFFYRPFCTNYVYGLTLTLALFMPLRLFSPQNSRRAGVWSAVGLLALGLTAGMANEHTGPVAIVAYAAGLVALRRAHVDVPYRFYAGGAGLLLGYALLFFSPAQQLRYAAVASQSSLISNVLRRGWAGNGQIFLTYAEAILPCIALAGLMILGGLGARWLRSVPVKTLLERPWWPPAAAMAAALAILFVTLVSPIVGTRLLLASVILAVVATVWLVDRSTAVPALCRTLLIAAVVANGWFFGNAVGLYWTTNREFDQRLAILEATPPGGVAVVPPYSHAQKSRLFFGDDFLQPEGRRRAARWFKTIAGIELGPGVTERQ